MSSVWMQVALIPIVCVGMDALYVYLCDELILAWTTAEKDKDESSLPAIMDMSMMKGVDLMHHSTRAVPA